MATNVEIIVRDTPEMKERFTSTVLTIRELETAQFFPMGAGLLIAFQSNRALYDIASDIHSEGFDEEGGDIRSITLRFGQ